MLTLIVIKLALVTFLPSSMTAIDAMNAPVTFTYGHAQSVKGRMPWNTESLVTGLPVIEKKGF